MIRPSKGLAGLAMGYRKARILILCKTYPSPSTAHTETSCVAGVEDNGKAVRIFPVPFRLIDGAAQFKKWQWITAHITKARRDHRPESHNIGVDTIVCENPPVSTRDGWADRLKHLTKIPSFQSPDDLEPARLNSGTTIALLRPLRILQLEITPIKTPDWTEAEKKKLLQQQPQTRLFAAQDRAQIAMLRKIPFDFYYRYAYLGPDGTEREATHKIVDWEIGALYWNLRKSHRDNWEAPFRAKVEQELPSRDLTFLMGTVHRFPDQWLIISVIYPPKRPAAADQPSLL
jgi:hypothetical protein